MHGIFNDKHMGCDALFTGTSYWRIGKACWHPSSGYSEMMLEALSFSETPFKSNKSTRRHPWRRLYSNYFYACWMYALSMSIRSLLAFVSVVMHLSSQFPEHTICMHRWCFWSGPMFSWVLLVAMFHSRAEKTGPLRAYKCNIEALSCNHSCKSKSSPHNRPRRPRGWVEV